MELAQKARRVIVTTTHTTRSGAPKILNHCTLPLTAKSCVNTIITELAVIEVTPEGLLLLEIAAEMRYQTGVGENRGALDHSQRRAARILTYQGKPGQIICSRPGMRG